MASARFNRIRTAILQVSQALLSKSAIGIGGLALLYTGISQHHSEAMANMVIGGLIVFLVSLDDLFEHWRK